ncbi:hypothetical protein [Bradyrhizobium japonicum]|uniref:hypothetical protein n=2 Tax=Nitrobacteraceae TaxID=41294 RepID=UPI0032221BA2
MVVVEGATHEPMDGATTMLALGLVLDTLGIGMLCWAIFALAVHALPFFVALNVGMIAFHGGAGLLGALLVGIGSGALMLVVGQFTLAASRSVISRILVAAAFSIPAGVAGYQVALALSHIGMASPAWRQVFACMGAVCACCTAWVRLNVLAETCPLEPNGQAAKPSQPAPATGWHKR